MGLNGSEIVKEQSANVNAECENLRRILGNLLDPRPGLPHDSSLNILPAPSKEQTDTSAPSSLRPARLTRLFRIDSEKRTTTRQSLQYVFMESERVKTRFTSIRHCLDGLKHDAREQYVVHHRDLRAQENDSVERIRLNAEAMITLECATRGKDAADALYAAAYAVLRDPSEGHAMMPGCCHDGGALSTKYSWANLQTYGCLAAPLDTAGLGAFGPSA